jgi:hypothetical protein
VSAGENLNWWFQLTFDMAMLIFILIIAIHVGRRR